MVKLFNDFLVEATRRSMNENCSIVGWTSECKAADGVTPHRHDYMVNEYGFGWTGPADKGISHIHEIIDGKVVAEGDGHTHKLLKADAEGPDTASFGQQMVLTNPQHGYGSN